MKPLRGLVCCEFRVKLSDAGLDVVLDQAQYPRLGKSFDASRLELHRLVAEAAEHGVVRWAAVSAVSGQGRSTPASWSTPCTSLQRPVDSVWAKHS